MRRRALSQIVHDNSKLGGKGARKRRLRVLLRNGREREKGGNPSSESLHRDDERGEREKERRTLEGESCDNDEPVLVAILGDGLGRGGEGGEKGRLEKFLLYRSPLR